MKDNVTFIMHGDWLENIKALPIEQQDKIIADMVRYGVGMDQVHAADPMVCSVVNMVKKSIDFSKEKYQQKVDMSKTAGRKKTVNDRQIYDMARDGKTANQIAEMFGVSKSTIDHSSGWKNRKKEDFEF